MDLAFVGKLWHWRGPAPYHFVSVPEDGCEEIAVVAQAVTYGWGMIPVVVTVGGTTWSTSLWPKDGGYVVPVKAFVRRDEGLELGMPVEVTVSIDL
ncbi:DUF1905 domain-containing protein [Nocardioides mangrovicus]|uniref:DUF1905 domain-containing protein n=1 Tax=Nocardioides mangrovicus TaxID=2478913 RepID=A0A3L8P1X6_9ACTN|nr:DUF1905 domain-containing protein [Nocardioides mangrovicus]RLV49305.1 DUF1905 domain-containing protein [Nocardioides mangrovicus]